MQSLVVGDINRMLGALVDKSGLARRNVWAAVVAGNTTMTHFLLGLTPDWIRREPYVGCQYSFDPIRASDIGVDINPEGRLFCLPSVSAYVGADVTAGVLATGLADSARPSMLIDLGTNGEIVIGNRDFLVSCSASAGPAFEGEASASGSRARPGAIDAVSWERGMRWKTIEDRPPVGLCGSGYIDLLAVLLRQGLIDRNGRLQDGSSRRMRRPRGNGLEYVLVYAEDAAARKDIVLTQADIDNLVRAKGAIYAAASVLMDSLGMQWSDLERIMLAGAFGDKIDKNNAVTIGLLPDVPREKIEFVGNSSLEGAVRATLSQEDFAKATGIARRMTYFELSTRADYMPQFVAACFLPHTDAQRFPSVELAGLAGNVAKTRRRR